MTLVRNRHAYRSRLKFHRALHTTLLPICILQTLCIDSNFARITLHSCLPIISHPAPPTTPHAICIKYPVSYVGALSPPRLNEVGSKSLATTMDCRVFMILIVAFVLSQLLGGSEGEKWNGMEILFVSRNAASSKWRIFMLVLVQT